MTSTPAGNATLASDDTLPGAAAPDSGVTDNQPEFITVKSVTGEDIQIPSDLSKVEDPDMRDYYQSLKDGLAEPSGADGGAPDPAKANGTTPGATDQGKPAAANAADGKPADAKPAADDIRVPKARLDEALSQADAERQNAAYWRGVAEARGQQQAPAGQQPAGKPAQPTPEQRLGQIASEIDALSEKFDTGELSMKDFKAKERALTSEEHAIREASLTARLTPKQQAAPPADDIIARRHVNDTADRLVEAHPFSGVIYPLQDPTDPVELGVIQAARSTVQTAALTALEKSNPGFAKMPKGPGKDLLWQEELARQSDIYGPRFFPNAKPAAKPAGGAAAPAGNGLTAEQQRRLDKIETANQQPPNVNGLGTGGGGTDYSVEALSRLSEDEYALLPQAVRDRALAHTPAS